MDELLSSFFLFFFKTTSQSKKGISFDNSRRMRELRSGGSFSYIYNFKKDPNFAWGFVILLAMILKFLFHRCGGKQLDGQCRG
jgi:hypothetical protein